MSKPLLKFARTIIQKIPKGKTFLINLSLKLAGREFNDFICINGSRLYINDINGMNRGIFFTGKYEEKETELVKNIISKDDYVFDIGANYGWYSLVFSKLVGNGGKVFAFELDHGIYSCLKKTANNNGNILTENIGMGGGSDKKIEYYYDDGNANLDLNWYNDSKKISSDKLPIKKYGHITTLDNYVKKNNISKVDFIKCDIDGAEIEFLKGARETIQKFKPVILIEVLNENKEEFHKELRGYSFEEIENNILCRPI